MLQLVDRYPPRIQPTVDIVRRHLNERFYRCLTSMDALAPRQNNYYLHSRNGSTAVLEFNDLPGWVIKVPMESKPDNAEVTMYASNEEGAVEMVPSSQLKRVEEAKKLRRIIKARQLDLLKVPKKYLCSLSFDRLFVLCEKCDVSERVSKLSGNCFEYAWQLFTLCQYASAPLDIHDDNLFIENRKIVLIDTEPLRLKKESMDCISPALRAARINVRNLSFTVPSMKSLCEDEICRIKRQEERLEVRSTALFTTGILVVWAVAAYWAWLVVMGLPNRCRTS